MPLLPQRPDPMAEDSGDAGVALARVPSVACRINALPDDVLLRALSYLGARQVVQTSVLSRRWRDLWRSVPRINATPEEFDDLADTEMERDVLFKAFLNRFLMLRNPVALDEFRLVYRVADDLDELHEDANLWIHHALQSNARSVLFSCICLYEVRLESAVFTSKCFLTNLVLDFVVVLPGFFRSLQIGCTLLERLILCVCTIADPDISSQTLKLYIENYLDWCPMFDNLTTLTLGGWCLHANFYALIVFLQNSPNLVKLTLKFIESPAGKFLGELEERSFTCKHLQTICLDGWKDDLVINSLKKFFLDNGITSDQIRTIDRI